MSKMKWSVGRRIHAGFGLALLLIVALGFVTYGTTTDLEEIAGLEARSQETLKNMEDLGGDIASLESAERGYVLTGQESYLQPFYTTAAGTDQKLKEIARLVAVTQSQQKRTEKLEALTAEKLAHGREIIDIRKTRGFEAAQQYILANKEKAADGTQKLIDEMIDEEQSVLKTREQQADRSARRAASAIIFGVLLSFALLSVAGFVLTRSITIPLRQMTVAAERISLGDLSVGLPAHSRNDEVGLLTDTFKRMVSSLQSMARATEQIASGDLTVTLTPQSNEDVMARALLKMVDNLRQNTVQVQEATGVLAASASEILASVTHLTSGAAETAAAVTETATTVEEVRQTAHISSQKAKFVSETAQRAVDVSHAGEASVIDTVKGMDRIREQMESIAESIVRLSEQSQAIAEIIASVNDLAEQSNLLSVNASIEAARAGDHGKGFAVVAQEVKTLAEQSKKATGQVRAILSDIQKATSAAVMAIEQGGKAVEAGVKQSTETGSSIQTLARSVAEAAQAALQIEASSHQQLTGVDQVTIAMENIKQASLHNVDSMRQLEVAAEGLNNIGRNLKQIVGHYRV